MTTASHDPVPAVALALLILAALVVERQRQAGDPTPGWVTPARILLVLLPIVTGFDRLLLGVHYTTDVLAG